jgi:hypothetical protein
MWWLTDTRKYFPLFISVQGQYGTTNAPYSPSSYYTTLIKRTADEARETSNTATFFWISDKKLDRKVLSKCPVSD